MLDKTHDSSSKFLSTSFLQITEKRNFFRTVYNHKKMNEEVEETSQSGVDALISETESMLELLNRLSSNVMRKDGMDLEFRKDMGRLVESLKKLKEIECDDTVPSRVLHSICNSKVPDSVNKHAIDAAIQEMQSMIESRNGKK